MHFNIVPNRGSTPTGLLPESYREGAKVWKVLTRTLDDGSPVHSFQTLMAQVQTIVGVLMEDSV